MNEYTQETDQQELDKLQEERDAATMAFATMLLGRRDEAVAWRASTGIERMWEIAENLLEPGSDERTYYSSVEYAAGNVPAKNKIGGRSRVVMNLIPGRTETAAGRFADTMLPVDGKNWALKVTPDPEIDDMKVDERPAMQQGQPITDANGQPARMKDVALDKMSRAEKAMAGMERVIDDQTVECDFNSKIRSMIEMAAGLGTGCIKGPMVRHSTKRRWQRQAGVDQAGAESVAYVVQQCEDIKPSSKHVHPRNVYPSPDCGEDIAEASYIWERDFIKPRQVRALMGVPGYLDANLERVLKEEPKRTSVAFSEKNGRHYSAHIQANSDLYEVWEYWGDVSTEHMELLGCSCPDNKTASACVVFINDIPVKAELNILETGDLPYDFFVWSKIPGLPWGFGVPTAAMWQQRVIDAGWRATMDNAGDSAGANVAIMGLMPQDGRWEITRNKVWVPHPDSNIDDARKGFAQFQIANNQQAYERIINLALRFMDLTTTLPTLFQGEGKEIPDTLGATNIMVDSSNIAMRARVKRFDDTVTKRHIRRYYDWNMQYHHDHEIKGDYEVNPQGVSVLFERDQQAQKLIQIFALKADPDIQKNTDWDKAVAQLYSINRLDIIKTDEQKAQMEQQQQAQPQQVNPALEVAQVRVQGELEKAKLVQESDMAELQFKAQQAELDRQHEKKMREYDLQIKMMEYSERRNIEIDKIKAQLALGSAGMNLQKELASKKAESGNPRVPQVAKPPTEPPQRAPVGEAYQQ